MPPGRAVPHATGGGRIENSEKWVSRARPHGTTCPDASYHWSPFLRKPSGAIDQTEGRGHVTMLETEQIIILGTN